MSKPKIGKILGKIIQVLTYLKGIADILGLKRKYSKK
jgi:hypothetical protein